MKRIDKVVKGEIYKWKEGRYTYGVPIRVTIEKNEGFHVTLAMTSEALGIQFTVNVEDLL